MQNTLQKLNSGEKVTIVALGDSNTELTWHTAGRLNWVGLLQEALFETYGRNKTLVINAGCCGEGAEGGLRRLDADALRHEPDLVILSYGINSMSGGEAGIAAHVEALRAIVARLRSAGCEALLRTPNPIVVGLQPRPPAGYVAGGEIPGMSVAPVAAATVALGAELGCAVVDHYTLWMNLRPAPVRESGNHLWLRMSDATHPNALGHLCFYRELAPYFGTPSRLQWEE